MASRRFIPPLLLVLLGAVPLFVGEDGAEREPTFSPVPPHPAVVASHRPSPAPDSLGGMRQKTATRERTDAPVARLDGSSHAAWMDQLALRQLAAEVDLPLAEEEWSALAAVTAHFQTVRQTYEASVAKVERRDDGTWRVEVPSYPEAGDMLRARFYETLQTQLGAGTTDLILDRLGPALEGYFGGFGVSVQTLQFTADGPGAADFLITRTIRYWNEPTDANALTTRRETHLPAVEDPTGHRWGAFLALLKGV